MTRTGRVDAWTSAPRALPSVTDELARLPRPVKDPSPVVWFVALLVGLSVLYVVILTVHTAAGGHGAGIPPLVAAMLLVFAAYHRRDTARARTASRIKAAVALWSCVGLFPLAVHVAMVSPITLERAPTPVPAAALGVAGCVVVALLAERRVHRARRWYPAVAAMQERRDLAEAWNDLLAVRDLLGDAARIERGVVELRWCPAPGWALVLVGGGEPLATAPAAAPEAWAATLRLAGVAADAVPEPTAGG